MNLKSMFTLCALALLMAGTSAKAAEAVNAPWAFSCSAAVSEAKRSCEINQTIERNNKGSLERLLRASVRVTPTDHKLALMVTLPNGIYLPGGIKLTIDGAEWASVPLQTCNNDGCYAAAPIDDATLVKLGKSRNLEVTFQSMQRKDVKIPVSLMGFEKTLARVRS